MSPLQALANYLDRQKRDLSGWVSNPYAQLERNVANWTTPREGVISKGGLSRGGSRIFSLRDSNNKPHVTIETSPVPDHSWSSIVQIKGKQNKKPVDQYIPYVQDFIKSGKWEDIGDYSNTNLIRKTALTPEEQTLFPDQHHFTLDEVKALRQGKEWKPIDNDPELGLEYHPDWLADD